MKTLVAINQNLKSKLNYDSLGKINFGSEDIEFGLINLNQPNFDTEKKENEDYVLIKVNAFSCNFRDKALLLENYKMILEKKRSFLPFGSEFTGTVIKKGKNVSEFNLNQKIIPNFSYPNYKNSDIAPGISTNFASLGWLKIHKDKITKAPKGLDEIGLSCFTLGSQTAQSMIRRSNILNNKDNSSLVFNGRSSTSLFIVKQLIAYGIQPIVVVHNELNKSELDFFRQKEIKVLTYDEFKDSVNNIHVSYIFDPFFDLNIKTAINCMKIFGTYVTCGFYNQHPDFSNEQLNNECNLLIREIFTYGIIKNLQFICNCLGLNEDLDNAIKLNDDGYDVGPTIDSIYKCENGISFVNRTFFDSKKFGKCALKYC